MIVTIVYVVSVAGVQMVVAIVLAVVLLELGVMVLVVAI